MRNLITLTLLCLLFNVNGQTVETAINTDKQEDKIYNEVETKPEFPGGMTALYEYLGDELTYPEKAKKDKIEGKIYIQFVINKKGEVKDVSIIKGADYLLEQEAIRVIEKMPNWIPGKQENKPVNVRYTLPIVFKLEE